MNKSEDTAIEYGVGNFLVAETYRERMIYKFADVNSSQAFNMSKASNSYIQKMSTFRTERI